MNEVKSKGYKLFDRKNAIALMPYLEKRHYHSTFSNHLLCKHAIIVEIMTRLGTLHDLLMFIGEM